MPTLSRWFIKIGMLYFATGLIMGALLLAQPVMGWSPRLQVLRPVYLHFLFIGWVSQLIMGVGYWMFPKQSKEQPRLRAIGEPAVVLFPQLGLGWTLAIASLCLLLAGWGFIINTWSRVKER
jgi:hypothetical protein